MADVHLTPTAQEEFDGLSIAKIERALKVAQGSRLGDAGNANLLIGVLFLPANQEIGVPRDHFFTAVCASGGSRLRVSCEFAPL